LLEVSILVDTKAPAYYGTSIEAREGGAKMVEIRADAFTEEQENAPAENEQKISIDELATLVATKVIEALKAEQKADEEEPDAQADGEAEEQVEPEEEVEEKADEEETEEQEVHAEEEVEEEPVEEETEENRSIDYSSFEQRLAKLKK